MTDSEQLEVPSNWVVASIQDIADINPTLDKTTIQDDLLVSFVPMPAVEAESGVINVNTTQQFGAVKKGYTPFCEGDVLFAKITPCMENGKMAIVPRLINDLGFGSTEFHVLRPYSGLEAKYLYYYVSSKKFRYDAEHNMSGAVGQRRVPKPYLSACALPLPPFNEQRRIVEKIEELFSELDKGVESLKTAKAQLKVYRQALLKHAFEGKLTAQWREENKDKLDSADQLLKRIKAEREAHYQKQLKAWEQVVKGWESVGSKGKKPTKPKSPKCYLPLSKEAFLGFPELPRGWTWDKLGWMTCGVEYGTSAKSNETGEVPVLRMGNIQNGKFDWSDLVYSNNQEEILDYSLSNGDVLFNRTNSPELVGKTAIYRGERPAIFAGYLIRINHISTIVESQYLNFFLNSFIAKKHGNSVKTDGVNQSNINGEKLANYPFPYCSLLEQIEIVRILEGKLSLIDKTAEEIDIQLQKGEALRQAILKRAFSGQLVPQDPNEEPASVLLERIQAERARQAKPQKSRKSKSKSIKEKEPEYEYV